MAQIDEAKEAERQAQQQAAIEAATKNAERKKEALAALSKHRHLLYRVKKWAKGSAAGKPLDDDRELEMDIDKANLITSALADQPGQHTIMLDLDVPAKLVSSTTPGHSHLYIDVKLDWESYLRFLGACTDAKIIEKGYYNISRTHMSTSLRLPWIKKEK